MERIFLGLGSNLGDRSANLGNAVERLQTGGVQIVRTSACYETEPVGGPPGQGKYLNAAIEVRSSSEPRELLDLCKEIERQICRQPTVRWGPRLIDIDILLWGDRVIDEPDLRVPHPEMANRAFVLVPLDEIAQEVYNTACGCTVHELTIQLGDVTGVERSSELFAVESGPGESRTS